MKKNLKKLILFGLSIASAATFSVALAACDGDSAAYPDYKKPVNLGGDGPGENLDDKYVVHTLSAGGMKLDGVTVTASKDGQVVKSGISSDGKVTFSLDDGVYDLSYSDLPVGYSVGEDTASTTSATDKEVKAYFPSSVIEQTVPSGFLYSVGDVMYDFYFTDSDGQSHTLSKLLETKKAVVLNFWYVACNPCRSELPAMQSAFNSYKDKLALLGLSYQDDNGSINKFKEQMKTSSTPVDLTFPMGHDTASLYRNFNVTAFPTTVIIDRYGVVASIHTGAIVQSSQWVSMFDQFTSDDYVQNITEDPENPGDGELIPDLPDVEDPPSSEIEDAVSGENFDFSFYPEPNPEDKLYSWPFVPETDESGSKYIVASNTGHKNSYAIVYSDVTLESNQVLTFEYNISIEPEVDYLYVFIDRDIALTLTGDSQGWKEETLFLSGKKQTIQLAFCYRKSEVSTDHAKDYEDKAKIRNLSITDASLSEETSYDIVREVASEPKADKTGYTSYSNIAYDKERGFYCVYDDKGEFKSILYLDMLKKTPWSELRHGNSNFSIDGIQYPYALYHIAYWYFSDQAATAGTGNLNLLPGHRAESDELIAQYYLQLFSDNGYIPVNEALRTAVNAFLDVYHADARFGGTRYENEWLEFCFYFDHYGPHHEDCAARTNPVLGMDHYNAIVANLGKNHVNIYRGKNNDPAVRFSFTAPDTATYLFYSNERSVSSDPDFAIYDGDGNLLVYQEDALNYDRFVVEDGMYKYGYDFRVYYRLRAGDTVYLYAKFHDPSALGEYDFFIEKLSGAAAEKQLLVCTTGEGTFLQEPDGTLRYTAIPVAYDAATNRYYKDENGDYGSVIYIDFIHGNFLDQNNRSLKELTEGGAFNFTANGGNDYTALMLEYYEKSVQGKDETEELYGLLEADRDLVALLDKFASDSWESPLGMGCWLSLACYYEYFV